jgi:hypothetical protein
MRTGGRRGFLLLFAIVLGRAPLPAQLDPPAIKSPWDLFIAGGKGIYRLAPLCRELQAFSGSPVLFDFEQDFLGERGEDLEVKTQSTPLGSVDGRQIIQVIQKIYHQNSGLTEILKRLLVQHSGEEFCAVYQQIYGATQVETKPASLIQIGNVRLLKTMDQNGNAVWNEEYWAFLNGKPTHLDLSWVYKQMSDVLPHGTTLANGPFDLRAECLERAIWKSTGTCSACGTTTGSVLARLGFRGGRLVARRVQAIPLHSPQHPICEPQ